MDTGRDKEASLGWTVMGGSLAPVCGILGLIKEV